MRKVFLIFVAVIGFLSLVSCDIVFDDTPNINNKDEQYEIFKLAQEAGYSGTYEEWLFSIKGEKGDQGIPGKDGYTPYVGENGNWWINDVDTMIKAEGTNGASVYDIYCEKNPTYNKSEEEWLDDLLNGKLIRKQTYTVVLYNEEEIIYEFTVSEGNLINLVEDPQKIGYTFIGWYTDKNDKWNFYSDCVYCDLNLYARFERTSLLQYIEKESYEKKHLEEITEKFIFTDKSTVYGQEKDGFQGTDYSSTYFKASNFVDISSYREKMLEITIPIYTMLSGGRAPYCLCFYDNNKESIGEGYQLRLGENSIEVVQIIIPKNATYIRTVYFIDEYTNYTNAPIEFSCNIWELEKIVTRIPIEDAYEEDVLEKTNAIRKMNRSELCDGFALTSDGNYEINNSYSITSYIDCFGAKSINISMMQINTNHNYGFAFYDQNKRLISFINCYNGVVNNSLLTNYDVPINAHYFKTTYFNSENRFTHDEFLCEIVYEENSDISKYRSYQSDEIYFSQSVNQNLDYYESDAYSDNVNDYKNTTGVLLLPTNYTQNGDAVPLIVYFHGLSHYVYYGKFGNTDNFMKQKEHWLAQGYAVLGCNGARDNNLKGSFRSSAPQFTAAYNKCIEYVLENYNIQKDVFVIGVSAGGPAAINYCYQYDNVKGLMLLSTWTDIYLCQWGQGNKSEFVEYLEFNSTSKYEHNKADKYDPAKHITVNESGMEYIEDLDVPVLAFIGEKEAGSIIDVNLRRYISALNNYNKNTQLIVWEGRDHTQICSGADLDVDNAVIDFFESLN